MERQTKKGNSKRERRTQLKSLNKQTNPFVFILALPTQIFIISYFLRRRRRRKKRTPNCR
jgi:hypothetical protein